MSAHAPAAEALEAQNTTDGVGDKPWYPPLPVWKLFLLLNLTLGIYSAFYLYRTARELRDHGNPKFKPWLYPFSILIALATAFAAHRLAAAAEEQVDREQVSGWSSPALITLLAFGGQLALAASGLSNLTLWYLAAVLLYSTPWLLLQRQLNIIKQDLPAEAFVTRPGRYTKRQWATLVAGALVFAVMVLAVWNDIVRLSGQELQAGDIYKDPQGRFEFSVPQSGWTIVAPGYVVDDAEVELLGPGDSDWAVVYVHDQVGWTIDDLVENRFSAMNTELPGYRETRQFIEGTEIAASYAGYFGILPLDGQSEYSVTSYVTDERAVEFIVFTAGSASQRDGGKRLAESIRPVTSAEEML